MPLGVTRAAVVRAHQDCEQSASNACAAPRADALWYHAPNICEHVQLDRASPGQMLVVASMEPAAYYPCLDNPAFMGLFDLEMSYRMQARRAPPDASRMHAHAQAIHVRAASRACLRHPCTYMMHPCCWDMHHPSMQAHRVMPPQRCLCAC